MWPFKRHKHRFPARKHHDECEYKNEDDHLEAPRDCRKKAWYDTGRSINPDGTIVKHQKWYWKYLHPTVESCECGEEFSIW